MRQMNPSPLRYPGGKYKISRLVRLLMDKAGDERTIYIEPFAGGAGIAIDLLLKKAVQEIVINDSDRAIASFWRSIVNYSEAFIDRMYETPITIDEWGKQRRIYESAKRMSIDYGFATFFLNRTNHSGILSSGPIGGCAQNGWTLDARFNKEELSRKIRAIAEMRSKIHIYNRDVFSFIDRQLPQYSDRGFVYFDPPYYNKGSVLYKNFFTHKMHVDLCSKIKHEVACPWIVSYDAVDHIRQIYKGVPFREFSLSYSLANNGSGREIMFFSDGLCLSDSEISRIDMAHQFGLAELSVSEES